MASLTIPCQETPNELRGGLFQGGELTTIVAMDNNGTQLSDRSVIERWISQLYQATQTLTRADSLAELQVAFLRTLPFEASSYYRMEESLGLAFREAVHIASLNSLEDTYAVNQSSHAEILLERVGLDNASHIISQGWAQAKVNFEIAIQTQVFACSADGWYTVPIIHQQAVTGMVCVYTARHFFDDAQFIDAFASYISLFVRLLMKHQLIQTVERENQVLVWMHDLSQFVLHVENEQQLWLHFRDMLADIGQSVGGVYVLRSEDHWTVADVFGILAPYKEQIAVDMIPWIEQRIGDHWRSRRLIWTPPNKRILPPYVREESSAGAGLCYYVGDETTLFAVLTLYFESSDVVIKRLIPNLLETLSMAHQVVAQRRRLKYWVNHDPLTGIWNRRALHHFMEVYFSQPSPQRMLFMLCDLDGFKALNDSAGHEAGDQLLCQFAHHLQSALTAKEHATRLGGDEFVLVLEHDRWDVAANARIDAILQASPLAASGVSSSVGVILLPDEAHDFSACYKLADARQYMSKRSGKNKITGPE